MSARSWMTSICIAIGVSIGAAAAQLGVGYGLNVVAWVPSAEDASRSVWLASLAWVTWLTANATVVGALCADWLHRRGVEASRRPAPPIPPAIIAAWRGSVAVAASIGALIAVPLVSIPARVAQQANNSVPQFTAGGYAVAGIIMGLIIAVGALSIRAIAANVLLTAVWLWLLAAVAVANGLRIGAGTGAAQLATWQFREAHWVRGMVNLPGALLMLSLAFAIGVGASWFPGRRGDHRVGVAVSGGIGPMLVAAAYFLAVPGMGGQDQQLSAYVTAPYAVIAGLAGSILVSAIGPKGARERARRRRQEREAQAHAEWQRSLGEDGNPSGANPDGKTTSRKGAKSSDAGSDPSGTKATAQPATPRRRRSRAKTDSPDEE